jgi:hypothetical protein
VKFGVFWELNKSLELPIKLLERLFLLSFKPYCKLFIPLFSLFSILFLELCKLLYSPDRIFLDYLIDWFNPSNPLDSYVISSNLFFVV